MADKGTSYSPTMLSLGMNLLGSWAGRYSAKLDQRVQQAQYQANRSIGALNNQLADQQAALANALRAGNNRIYEAQARAENVMNQINNRRLLARAQDEHAQAAENFLRTQESMVQGNLEEQIAAAEQRGAYAASTALSGTLGSSVDGIEQALALKQNRLTEQRFRQQGYATSDQLKQMVGIVPAAIASRNTGTAVANLDYGYSFSTAKSLGPEQMPQENIAGNFFTDAWRWAAANPDGFRQVGTGVSSWFKSSPFPEYFGNN